MINYLDEMKKLGKIKSDELKKNLEKKNIKLLFFENLQSALESAISKIDKNAVIGFGGSKTIEALGLIDYLKKNNYKNLLDRSDKSLTPEQKREIERKMFLSDIYLTGTNAITIDGQFVNTDKWGNRVAAMIFGPKKIFIFAGINKIVKDLNEAFERIKKLSAPLNSIRFNLSTPCTVTGYCMNCSSEQKICYVTTIINGSPEKDRITLFLINEYLGF
ncbi:MAG TPA: lactate utilization protein [bacterium]|nr:lactate utilization protein [bacterium]HOL46590.1 lactate utilization protein [bacterium]HPQ17839.1 lactate utilization protein [bacterium]